MQKQTLLDKLDGYFASKKQSEVTIMFVLVAAIIVFVVYYYVFPMADDYANENRSKLTSITAELNKEKAYMASVSSGTNDQFKIQKMQQEIKNTKLVLEKATNTNAYVDGKLKELSYLLFNEQNWAKFLDELALLADQYNIKITKIENSFYEPTKQKIEQVLNVTLQVDGNFKNIVKLINSVEENQLVVDIHELNITKEKNLEGTMKIAVWGMKYWKLLYLYHYLS